LQRYAHTDGCAHAIAHADDDAHDDALARADQHADAVAHSDQMADAAVLAHADAVRSVLRRRRQMRGHISALGSPPLAMAVGRHGDTAARPAGRGVGTVVRDVYLFLRLPGAHGGVVTALALAAITATVMGLPLLEGDATWYGYPYIGRRTASGTVYTGQDMTCAVADRELLGAKLLVNANSGSVIVKVDDTGDAEAFAKYGVAIDLSIVAFRRLAGLDVGTLPARVWRVG